MREKIPLASFAKLAFMRAPQHGKRALSSVVERLLHTQEVAGSNPAARTISSF